jgi:hypothetical protein
MAIKIVYEDGLCKPVVFCDHCGEAIRDAKDGNYQWQDAGDGDAGPLHFTHKGCFRAFERAHEGFWYANELACRPAYLADNLSLNWDRAKKVARFMASI